jgi:hypothetical protein
MFVGDINLGEYYTSFGHGPATYSKQADIFECVSSLFDQADMVIGNLEAPLTLVDFDKKCPNSSVLRGNPSIAKDLKSVGFEILQVANNHAIQHGSNGFLDTVQVLTSAGIDVIGLKDQSVLIKNHKGISVGFIAASDVIDNNDTSQELYQRLDEEFVSNVKKSIELVDHLFVMLHWGLESSTRPLGYQREMIARLSQIGVHGVIGSHPHLFYEVWLENKTIAAPSLGNFVFDLGWDDRLLRSGILDVNCLKTSLDAYVWPVKIKENGCLPVPSDQPLSVAHSLELYDHGENMKGGQFKKVVYFSKNILKGNLMLKLKFIFGKILCLFNIER